MKSVLLVNHTFIALISSIVCSGAALAGRPLTVDDANTNERGAGHVEAWFAHASGSNVWTVAPAYAPFEGVEFGAAYARDNSASTEAGSLQVKWRITPSQESGCNFGAVLGVNHLSGQGSGSYLNGLLSCNFADAGSAHANLGSAKASGTAAIGTWGMAYERAFGLVTAHVEWFGSEGSKPTLQFGARGNVAKNWQLDGTVGRSNGVSITSVGLKYQF